eukprot:360216-Pelagomonas_calceolata.AAC.2
MAGYDRRLAGISQSNPTQETRAAPSHAQLQIPMAVGQQAQQRGPLHGPGPPMQFTNSMYPLAPPFVPWGMPLPQGPMPLPPPLMRPPPVFNPPFLQQQQRRPPSTTFADNGFPMDRKL